jgi:hypothetical protein
MLAGAPDHVSSRCISFLYFLDFSFFLNFQNFVKTLGFQSFCIICCQFFFKFMDKCFRKVFVRILCSKIFFDKFCSKHFRTDARVQAVGSTASSPPCGHP